MSVDELRLSDDGPDGIVLIVDCDRGKLALSISSDVLYAFLDSRDVQALLEHRAVGESIRVERARTGGLSYAEAFDEVDPAEQMREQADLARDIARGK